MSVKYKKSYEEYINLFKKLCDRLFEIPENKDLKSNNLPSQIWYIKNCPDTLVKDYNDLVKWIFNQDILNNEEINTGKNWKPTKTYYEYILIFKSVCKKLKKSITVNGLRNHNFELPTDKWFIRYCPNNDVKSYNDFLKWLDLKPSKNKYRKYTFEIACEEFAKRGLILPPQKYINCAIPLNYICPLHPNIIQTKSLNSLIFGGRGKGTGCPLCHEYFTGVSSNWWKGGISSLNTYLREFIKDWKKDSMENCEYKCVLTDGKFDAIHHLYSYSKIIKETIDECNLPIYTEISEYTTEELDLLKSKVREIHRRYPLGVCLCKEVHDLYHKLYGHNNTPEQFEEFKVRYNNGEFCDIEFIDNNFTKTISIKIDTSKLSEGLIINSYREMCSLLSIIEENRPKKKILLLLYLKKYFDYRKVGRSFIIDKILI